MRTSQYEKSVGDEAGVHRLFLKMPMQLRRILYAAMILVWLVYFLEILLEFRPFDLSGVISLKVLWLASIAWVVVFSPTVEEVEEYWKSRGDSE